MEPTGCNVISKEELDQWLDWLAKDGLGADIVRALQSIPVVKRKRKVKSRPCYCGKSTIKFERKHDKWYGECFTCHRKFVMKPNQKRMIEVKHGNKE